MNEIPLIDYLGILKRWKLFFAATALVALIVTLPIAATWKNYRSSALVQIEHSEVAAGVTSSLVGDMTGESLADRRISDIQQKVLSTSSLVEIIKKYHLYPKMWATTSLADISNIMRSKIGVNLVSSALANPASAQHVTAGQLSAIAFQLSFDYNDPAMAQKVTNELVSRFMEQDLEDKQTQTKETSAFLQTQLDSLEKSLVEQEKKIAEFHMENGDVRPDALMFNQQIEVSVTMSLQNLDAELTSNEGSLGALKAQLASTDPYSRIVTDGRVMTTPSVQLKALQSDYASLSAQYGPQHPDVLKVARQIESLKGLVDTPDSTGADLQQQITDAQTHLAKSQNDLGSQNPDVIALKRKLENLKAQKAVVDRTPITSSLIKKDADNPAYLQIVAQLKSVEEQRKALQAQRNALLKQQSKFRQAIVQNPAVVEKLAALSRDYDNSQIRYRALKEKKMAADMSQQIENDRSGQRLSVVNPPSLPFQTQPARKMLLIGALVFSLSAGMGVVVLAQFIKPCLYGPNHLATIVGMQPLIVIPHILTAPERLKRKRLLRYGLIALGVMAVLGVLVFSFMIMPLDVLWILIMRRLGLA